MPRRVNPVHQNWNLYQDFPASRDIIQPKLFNNGFGAPGIHAPFIPQREIEHWAKEDSVLKLKNGSIIGFKSCDSGILKFAGAEKDWVLFDEDFSLISFIKDININ